MRIELIWCECSSIKKGIGAYEEENALVIENRFLKMSYDIFVFVHVCYFYLCTMEQMNSHFLYSTVLKIYIHRDSNFNEISL